MEDSTFAWFGVHDFTVEPAVITQLMGLEPTQVLIAGQPDPKYPKRISRVTSWALDSSLATSVHVEEHLESLLTLLESRAEAIADLTENYGAELEIGCAIYYEDFTPGIHLSQKITRRLARLNLALDLDLYFLGQGTT